jgi:hypothetical protein
MHTHTIDRHVKYDIILLLFELVELQKTPAAYLGVAPDDRRRRISGSGQRGASRKPSPGRAVTGVVVLRYCCLGYETGGPVGIYNVTAEYSSEMERMMKVQDVLLKAMARKITRWAAAEILGVTDRTMRRWRERLEKDGYAGLADRRKGKPSAQRIPLATVEKVLSLYKEMYYDLNIRHFHEKLRDEHTIHQSASTEAN